MQPRLLRSPARLAGVSLLRLQSDERLVALARDGHEQAFAAIVERYRSALERYAGRLAGAERAEDAVQQAFVSAHRSLISDPTRDIDLRPWLYRIVHNTSLNQLRGARDEAPLEAAALASLPDDAVERRERLREALDAVAALPAAQRDAILLRELEGRSHEEIASALGVTAGAARQHLFRARTALRAAITAVTPQPLLERLLFAASGSGATEAAAAGGAGLLVAKAGAGLLATGALFGGAVGTGVVHGPGHHGQPPARTLSVEAVRPAAAVPIADRAQLGHETVVTSETGDDRGSKHDGSKGGDDGARHGSTSGSGDEGERHGSGDDGGRSGPGSGSGDDDRRSGTGSSSGDDDRRGTSGSGDADRKGSISEPGDDGGRSGSGSGTSGSGSGGSGSGSDDGSGTPGTDDTLSSGSGSGDEGGTSGSGSGVSGSGSGGDDATESESGSGSRTPTTTTTTDESPTSTTTTDDHSGHG